MADNAFVTLITSDKYLPGALTLAAALQDVHPSPPVPPEVAFQTVCLVTPETVDVSTIKLLRRAFNVVIGVEVITQEDDKGLQLLGRPDLNTVLTKLHVFRLTQYSKIIFLDADVLPIRPLSHLFTLPYEFSAVPDVGWPDIFNSGVMVLSPGLEKFQELRELLDSNGSWDGGDQGLLNEWRGDNWNRISFTYNTTPTAAYTYAPAYERFGSKISAIHFIGSNKPWNVIPYRAPFSQSSETLSQQHQQAYDYNSLLDRWFAVYDKYYRAEVIVPETDFDVRPYVSAWNDQADTGATQKVPSEQPASDAPMSLEELRSLAIQGMSSVGLASTQGEGEYTKLPLDGRFDLMRLQPSPKESTSQTPASEDVPSSPHPHPVPLPNTDSFQSEHYANEIGQSQRPGTQPRSEPPRRLSPPLLLWNAAVEPPPTKAPLSNFPKDTYFPNQWDQAHSTHNYQHDQRSATSPTTLFEPLPPSQIPEPLQKLGHYQNVTGAFGVSHTPDPNKVKPIFPWEGQPRQRPGRVFPPGEDLPQSKFAGQVSEDYPSTEARATSPSRAPHVLTFANAWDTVPSIQRYASKLVQPPPQPLAAAFDGNDHRKRSDRASISSRDGDDEDNADDDDSSVVRWGESDNEADAANTRSRRDSNASASQNTGKGKKKEYRVRGVQTPSREMRDQAVQVDPSTKVQPQSPSSRQGQDKSSSRHRKTSLSSQPGSTKKQWSPPSTSTAPPVISHTPDVSATIPLGSPKTPPFGRSPRTSIYNGSSPMNGGRTTNEGSPTSVPQTGSPTTTVESPGPSRQASHDGSSWTSSPPSSLGPISPPDGARLAPNGRKGSRVWDPARGVDLFKRGSEEVLARFLRMGSWDESPNC